VARDIGYAALENTSATVPDESSMAQKLRHYLLFDAFAKGRKALRDGEGLVWP